MSHNKAYWFSPDLPLIVLILTSVAFIYICNFPGRSFSDTIDSVQTNLHNSSPTLENVSTTLIPNFSEFRGLGKNFSLQYPSDWTLEPQTNSPDQVGLKITSPNGVQGGLIKFGYAIIDRPLLDVMKKNHINLEEIEKNLIFLFPIFLDDFGKTLDNYGHKQKPNYVKYLMDGHKTGSAIFNFSEDDNDLVGLLVWTLVGKNQYWFVYASSQESFNQKLPVAEQVLQSIKLPLQLTS